MNYKLGIFNSWSRWSKGVICFVNTYDLYILQEDGVLLGPATTNTWGKKHIITVNRYVIIEFGNGRKMIGFIDSTNISIKLLYDTGFTNLYCFVSNIEYLKKFDVKFGFL